MIYLLVSITILIGALMPVQAGLNAELGRIVENRYFGAFISFFTGTIGLTFVLLFQPNLSEGLKKIPFHNPLLLTGGILGALFVVSSILLIPRLGATTMMSAFITGQLIMAVAMDHYGLLGLTVSPLNWQRGIGVVLLFVGLALVLKKAA